MIWSKLKIYTKWKKGLKTKWSNNDMINKEKQLGTNYKLKSDG